MKERALQKQQSGHKIGIYIRVSTEEQAQNEEGSIRNQEQRLRQQVEIKNMDSNFGEIVDVFIDRAKSGKDTNRPELQRMLAAIQNNEINFVMATELSRISRSIKDFSEIWELIQNHGCGFQSLRENFDSTSAAGEMVLFTVANIAQFERRQVSERVLHNMTARAKRGLYNGGVVPFGYQLIPGKPGYLEINKEHAQVVKSCFEAFLQKETLSRTAKHLNNTGLRLSRQMQGGGGFKRLKHFTVDNLHHILRNKAYAGIKVYKEKGIEKTAKAVWPPIIDENVFNRVQEILTKNHHAKKPSSPLRYPYLLTGICYCKSCGDHLSGKSAHGNGGKIPYYEHAWATKRNATLSKQFFKCKNPKRFSGKKLEALVQQEVLKLLTSQDFAKRLFNKTQQISEDNKDQKEMDRLKAKVQGLRGQLDTLAERLSELPKSVSAAPIFKQMEVIERQKEQTEALLAQLKANLSTSGKPAELKNFLLFTKRLKTLFKNGSPEVKEKIIKRFIHKVEVDKEAVTLHYIVDSRHYNPQRGSSDPSEDFFKNSGSNSLTNGRG